MFKEIIQKIASKVANMDRKPMNACVRFSEIKVCWPHGGYDDSCSAFAAENIEVDENYDNRLGSPASSDVDDWPAPITYSRCAKPESHI